MQVIQEPYRLQAALTLEQALQAGWRVVQELLADGAEGRWHHETRDQRTRITISMAPDPRPLVVYLVPGLDGTLLAYSNSGGDQQSELFAELLVVWGYVNQAWGLPANRTIDASSAEQSDLPTDGGDPVRDSGSVWPEQRRFLKSRLKILIVDEAMPPRRVRLIDLANKAGYHESTLSTLVNRHEGRYKNFRDALVAEILSDGESG